MVDMLDEGHGFKEQSIVFAEGLKAERKNGVYVTNQMRHPFDQRPKPLFKKGTFFVKNNWKKGGE